MSEADFGKRFVDMLFNTPELLFCFIVIFLTGYGISFLLFNYKSKESHKHAYFHLIIGASYTAVILLIVSWKDIFSSKNDFSFDDLLKQCPRVLLISLGIFFIISIPCIIIKEKRSSRGGVKENG